MRYHINFLRNAKDRVYSKMVLSKFLKLFTSGIFSNSFFKKFCRKIFRIFQGGLRGCCRLKVCGSRFSIFSSLFQVDPTSRSKVLSDVIAKLTYFLHLLIYEFQLRNRISLKIYGRNWMWRIRVFTSMLCIMRI